MAVLLDHFDTFSSSSSSFLCVLETDTEKPAGIWSRGSAELLLRFVLLCAHGISVIHFLFRLNSVKELERSLGSHP